MRDCLTYMNCNGASAFLVTWEYEPSYTHKSDNKHVDLKDIDKEFIDYIEYKGNYGAGKQHREKTQLG
jgi:hypothetical protein